MTDYEPITGGYSRLMTKVFVEDSKGRHGCIIRSDPPPGQSILDTDRAPSGRCCRPCPHPGQIPMPAPRWFDSTGDELGSPSIVIDLVDGEALISPARKSDDQ